MATVRRARNVKSEAYIIDHVDPYTGKRRRKTFKGSRKQAEMLAKELDLKRYRISNGTENSIRSNLWLNDLVEQYQVSIKNTKNPKTVIRENYTLNGFNKYMGSRRLESIRPMDIQNYVDDRLHKGLSPNTVNLEIRNLKVFFNFGVKNFFIEKSPMIGVKGPKPRPKKVRFLTVLEIQDLLKVIDNDSFRNLIITYLNTGARREELVPPLFTWSCVDFINHQLQLTGKHAKTRYVPLNSKVEEILQSHKAKGFEFPFNFKIDYVSHRLADYYKEAGIKDANVHVLRKTFGSLLIQKQLADIYVVSKLLGHSSVKVTETHYVDLLKENIDLPVEKLADIIQPK
mgnify:FL=1